MTTTTMTILTAVALLPLMFALGFALGHHIGKSDGRAEYRDWTRTRRV